MGKYIFKRVLLAIVTIFIVCFITFFTMNAIPGGPFAGEKAKSPEVQAALEKRFNLDKPVGEQFVIYMKNLLHGDFGISAKTGREISETIGSKFAVSAKLGIMAVLLAVALGVVFGSIAALQRNRWPDRVIIFLSTLFTSLPSFVLGSFLLVIFSVKLGWVHAWSPTQQNLVLPVIALAMYPAAYITRLTKTSMLDVMGQDYVRTARAKGVAQWKVLFVHTLRNALIPVVTYLGPMIAGVLTGSLVVEQIFTIGGLGAEFVQSITNRDYPMIMGVTIFLAVFMVTMNLLTDIVYKLIDPRINLD
ncbi:MAG: ABC transporter permease [Lachnospiraceae bacterium]|nr:ABC transporter permease [Lachnospiraceae bacterium]